MSKIWSFFRLFWLAPLVMLLSSCYIPYGYLTKIEVAKDGRYELNFHGRLLSASFLSKIGKNEITSGTEEYEAEKLVHFNELKRMGFSNIEYTFPASYEVKLDSKGNLFKERMVAFPGRSGSLLVMKLLKDNRLVIESRRLNKKYIHQLESSNIQFVGNVVIWTDMPVSGHNADMIQPGNPDAYVWEMRSLSENPLQLIGTLGNTEGN